MNNHAQQDINVSMDQLVSIVGIGVWDWDIPGNCIRYNKEYANMLGIAEQAFSGTLEQWKKTLYSKDLPRVLKLMGDYLLGKSPGYECETRLRHKDGSYIWVRDAGRIVARDAQGKPARLIGGCVRIDQLKRSEKQLSRALESLEHKHSSLETAVEKQTREMAEQGKLLWTVNQISRKLLAVQSNGDFESLVRDCLRLLGETIDKSRVYIWKDRIEASGRVCCTQIYEWVRGVKSIQGDERFEEIPYERLPAFKVSIDEDRCLNSLLRDLSDSEKEILAPQGIKTILIAPIAINGNPWGFIGVDNCEQEQLFTGMEENLLLMSGSMLANTIEKMETDAALREMEERSQIMLNAVPLCCNLWTSDFQNMSCNDEAVRLFELSSQQEYLARFHELSPEYQPCGKHSSALAMQWVSKAFQEGYCRFEWLHQKLDGTPIPAEITLVRIKYKNGYIVAGYTRDLREQKAMLAELKVKEALRRARDEALLSSQAKSNFLANMSHEIRTPMHAISGLADIILRESTSDKTTEYAQGIKGACGNLINIINDILDISKIEQGKLEIYSAPYDFSSLLNDVITMSRIRLGSKPLMFVTNIDSRLPAQMVGDEVRIKQILLNMLSNAIKFTQTGYVALRVSGTVEGDRATLRFSVEDSGIGIRAQDLGRLFEEFERVNTTKNRGVEGTGLGLPISKQLCKMMGGSITVESTYGKGSKFVAVIPQECPSYERLAQVESEKHVLLYEPRERYCASICETLHNLDCPCVCCTSQSELYEHIDRMHYDYILTAALHLEKVKTIAQSHRLSAPVAVIADYGETPNAQAAATLWVPASCLQIAALLNGKHETELYADRDEAKIKFVAPSARVLVVDDNPVNLQVAKGLMEPYRFSIDTAANGREAVEKVMRTQYDLVFMDHMMPEMDGVDATAAIRKLEGDYYQKLPIVALTANALVGTREMFIREGMNDFLAKPIDLNKLAHIFLKWLPLSKIIKAERLSPGQKEEPQLKWSIAEVDVEQGILRVGGSKENYLQILSVYYSDGIQKCASLPRYLAEQDLAAFRTEIHALKSTSATIGAMRVSTLAARLETAVQTQDLAFIDANIDRFLSEFKAVLEAILPNLPSDGSALTPKASAGKGDLAFLKQQRESLRQAAELASIGQLEALMDRLETFDWAQPITEELLRIRKQMELFDYDGVLDCVERLKDIV